jgi:hypothetical protein
MQIIIKFNKNVFIKIKKKKLNFLQIYYLYINNTINDFCFNTNLNDYNIFRLNLKKNSFLINFFYKNLLILNLTSGIIRKKLDINSKKIKKDFKMLKFMIKLSIQNINDYTGKVNQKLILNIKGMNYNFLKILSIFRKLINLNEVIFIHSCNIKNKFKFKKNKAIKRKLKKKLLFK